MKLKNLKRILSVLLTGLISLNAVSFTALADDVDNSSHFTYEVASGIATITTFDNLITDVMMPEQVTIEGVTYKIEDQTLKIKPKLFGNSTVEKVTFPNKYTSFGDQQMFYNAKSLKEVIVKYDGEEFTFNRGTFYGCSGLEKIHVYAQSIKYTHQASMFSKVPTTAVAYVQNNRVKAVLEELSWPGTIEVNDESVVVKEALQNKITEAETFLSGIDKSKYNNVTELETAIAHAKAVNENASATQDDVDNEVIALTSALNNVTKIKQASSFTITKCESIFYGTEGGFKPKVDITAGDGEIIYKLFIDESCTNESIYNYRSSFLPIGTYYLKGFMAETDNYKASSSNPFKVQILAHINVDKTALNEAIEEANNFYEENQYYKDDYDTTAWNNIYHSSGTFPKAKEIADDTEGKYSQPEINTAAENLTKSFNYLKTAIANTDDVWAEMQNVIEQAEKIIAEVDNGEEVYTEESYDRLISSLQKAKELDKNTSTKRTITRVTSALQYAIDNLEIDLGIIIEPGEPFAYIKKGGKEVKVASLIADESMNGSAKIKVTFDCAKDVSFNESASIEVKAVAAKMQSYKKFIGNSWTQGATCEIELLLVQKIKTGDQVDISAFTYAWENAKDYVYGITRVEFYDEKGHILKTIIDKDFLKDDLAEAISKAESIDTTLYTDESV